MNEIGNFMSNTTAFSRLLGFNQIAPDYKLVLCDVWGVIHNGIAPFSSAPDALERFRVETGGRVILLTNAPRPAWWVQKQLQELGVKDEAYDAIVTSGDVTRRDIISRGVKKVFALGPEKDHNFYDDLPVELVSKEEAEIISVTGLLDDKIETPDDYDALLSYLLSRKLDMICANPDIIVEKGDRLIYCGGALAEKYLKMGGNAHYCGKPHAPIYLRALQKGAELTGLALQEKDVLAIGDGIATDVKGANDAGLDCLFITGGIHSAEKGPLANASVGEVAEFLKKEGRKARAFMLRLSW